MNKEIIDQFKEAKDTEELKTLAGKSGYPLSDEEAKNYFELLHKTGKIADDELANVSGGACSKSRNGSLYSGNPPHLLITTVGNACNSYKYDRDAFGFARNCNTCLHKSPSGVVLYCSIRTYDNDEYNPAK